MLSRAVKSLFRPPVNSIKGATPPVTLTLPSSGNKTPAINLNKVLLPSPFAPINPTASPALTSKLISLKAQNAPLGEVFFCCNNISLIEKFLLRFRIKLTPIFLTSITTLILDLLQN